MVYEANARVRDPVYGCVGAISSLQRQVDQLQTQLALAQAEVVHLRTWYATSVSGVVASPPSKSSLSAVEPGSKPLFLLDMVVDQPCIGESMWSC
ncbi:LOB domain-containing protein 4 [Acorus calamus]|uniref:LOB domain-containing protein 4 n=1 Tax=Acorus calamus TaxID=4465 RepID=A0AAV9C592_ACOCL|nr:LOB domain-containing protein 4 [Acorus calamus]